jgi:MFS family permease
MTVDRSPSTTLDEVSTGRRIRILAGVLAVTAVVIVPAGVLWPETSTGNETYAYSDIEPVRQLWWWLLLGLATIAPINVIAQSIVTMVLVRWRGSTWATWGAVLMWVGIVMQGAGVAFMAGAYFFPTSPDVDRSAGTAVIGGAAEDQGHLFAVLVVGALTVIVGTVLQAVGLLRARVVPIWVPIGTLFAVITFIVPGNGLAGLITSIPMAVGAIGLAFYVWRAVDRSLEAPRSGPA